MNAIKKKFKDLEAQGKKAFIAYITCGYPDIKTTKDLIKSFSDWGVDIVELGVPFSDPLADGPTIQMASQAALKKKVNLETVLRTAREVSGKIDMPLVIMSYYNPIFHYGIRRFISRAAKSGISGLIIPDLPPDEAGQIEMFSRQYDIATVYFVTPTSSESRTKLAASHSRGFIYYVSLTGVTGARKKLPAEIKKHIKSIKQATKKPVCVGFGISNAKQAKEIAAYSDGVIMGSAIIDRIEQAKSKKVMFADIKKLVKSLVKALH